MAEDPPDAASDTWNTPREIVELARAVMGGIDTDPATNDAAQAVVRAAVWYTEADNGLAQEWPGNVWCNPPYSRGLIGPFVAKLLAEVDAGRTEQAVVLVNARTGSAWFQALAARAARCDVRKRVRFWRTDKPKGSVGRCDSVAFYIGPHTKRFVAAFSALGNVTLPAKRSVTRIVTCPCGAVFVARRPHAWLCSMRCRVRWLRIRRAAAGEA
jgi:phage N-6-adenine-methyltransferase